MILMAVLFSSIDKQELGGCPRKVDRRQVHTVWVTPCLNSSRFVPRVPLDRVRGLWNNNDLLSEVCVSDSDTERFNEILLQTLFLKIA